jgi:hypothetical protein
MRKLHIALLFLAIAPSWGEAKPKAPNQTTTALTRLVCQGLRATCEGNCSKKYPPDPAQGSSINQCNAQCLSDELTCLYPDDAGAGAAPITGKPVQAPPTLPNGPPKGTAAPITGKPIKAAPTAPSHPAPVILLKHDDNGPPEHEDSEHGGKH